MYSANFWHFKHLFSKKIIILFLAFAAFSNSANAQLNYLDYVNKKLYFGITMGVNVSTFKYNFSDNFTYNDTLLNVTNRRGPGFNLGIVSNLKLGEYFDLRFTPALSFADKSLDFGLPNDSTVSKNIESINIEFPVSIRLKSPGGRGMGKSEPKRRRW